MASLFLIRHGEPELKGVFLGQLDSPLSEAGRAQVSTALSKVEVEITWHSTLLRATQTAAYVRSLQRVALADLREIDYGVWTGKTWAAIEAEWKDIAQRKSADWLNVSAPGGESWTDFIKRVGSAWDRIRRGPFPAAVIAHQAVNAALANLIVNRDPLTFEQHFGEVIRVEYD